MKAVSRYAVLVAIALSLHDAWGQESAGQPAPIDGPERVLVLQDAGVLSGRIEREGDRFIVSRGGGQIRVSAANVLFECGSLDEAYEQRRRQITRPTAEAHLSLAEWCLRYDLVAQARRELTDAQALDARHPRLALIERRLAHASQSPRTAALAEVSEKSSSSPTRDGEPPGPAIAGAWSRRDKPTSSRNFKTGAGEISVDVVERFTRKVQPVLVNNCTTAGCHQPGGAQQFQLDRALLHGLANRRSTMNNLTATLALVDRDRPQLSPLLLVPRQAHGGMDNPVFGPRQEQAFNHLVDWVALVTRPDSSKLPAEAELPLQAKSDSETASSVVPTLQDDDAEGLAPATKQLRFGARLESWQPRDPFDPEIFNRQRFARQQKAESEQSSDPQAIP